MLRPIITVVSTATTMPMRNRRSLSTRSLIEAAVNHFAGTAGPRRVLDLGTGSGVLGIGCCKSGLTGEGYDIDMLAVENAIENRQINGIEGFEVGLGSIDALEGRTYDLVLANILARPLIDLAQRIVWACKPGACLVLSGLLEIQADSVEEAYMAQCLPKPRRVIDGEWCALVWD